LSAILDDSQEEARPDSPDSPAPRKRVRRSNNLNEMLRVATLSSAPKQISALQTLAFSATMAAIDSAELANIINSVMPLMSHGNGTLASWAFLVLCGCARQATSRDKTLNQSWVRVWQFTTRAIPSQATSRAAAWLGNIIMVLQLVPYSAMAESLEQMQSRPDLAGPAALADSSIAFWLSLTRLVNSESPSISQGSSEKILSWVFRKWFPSRSK
jgi:ataxia telangiectasia mutated family protein